ncbi:MAG: hypothetical protein ABIP51_17000 [Bacteroidia bacterium]
MKKRILAVVFLLFFCLAFNAQTDSVYYGTKTKDSVYRHEKPKDKDWLKKVTYGSDFQAIFGTYTNVYLAPTIGYKPIDKLNVAVGFIYSYVSINYNGYGRISQTIYGGHSYARFFFNESFFAQGQFDHLLQPDVYNYNDPEKKVWVDYTMVGGGYRQSLGKRAALVTSLMINVSPSRLSIYGPSPLIFQVGFVGGF